MDNKIISPLEIPVEELDWELVSRGAKTAGKEHFQFNDQEGTPARDAMIAGAEKLYNSAPGPNQELADLRTDELGKLIQYKTRSSFDIDKGSWYDNVKDWYETRDFTIAINGDCTAAVMLKDNLTEERNGFFTLNVKDYGKTFNLCETESFFHQPVSAGFMCGGFLVKDDVIVTSGHQVNENNVNDLRFVFGYKMVGPINPVTRFAGMDIYRGVKMIRGEEKNWAVVKLDRKVLMQKVAVLSTSTDELPINHPVYVIGYPLGLPMKFSTGASVIDNTHGNHFTANLKVYSSCSGSPVFDFRTHEIIGMVVKNVNCDFRWTGNCWISVNYPDDKKADCTRSSEFIAAVSDL